MRTVPFNPTRLPKLAPEAREACARPSGLGGALRRTLAALLGAGVMTPLGLAAPFDFSIRTVSVGNTWDLGNFVETDDVEDPTPSELAPIVGMAVAGSNDHVYVWYEDGMQSAGSLQDFDSIITARSYGIPGWSTYLIRGMGIAKSSNQVCTWTTAGTVYEGWSRDLSSYGGPNSYPTPGYGYDSSMNWANWYGDMKVDHLMSHTAGFVNSGDISGACRWTGLDETTLSYDQLHRYMLISRKLLFEPGTAKDYSNHGMGLVGHIVAQKSGQTLREYARDNIIDPLGLNIRTMSEGQGANDMWRHQYVSGIPDAYLDVPASDLGLAAGGWKASAGDMVRLMLATDQDDSHMDVLDPETLDLMQDQPYEGTSSFAHGWDKNGAGKLDHSGGLGGGTTYIAKYPAGYLGEDWPSITVAVITNVSISEERGGSWPLSKLAGDIAVATERANCGQTYDLY